MKNAIDTQKESLLFLKSKAAQLSSKACACHANNDDLGFLKYKRQLDVMNTVIDEIVFVLTRDGVLDENEN